MNLDFVVELFYTFPACSARTNHIKCFSAAFGVLVSSWRFIFNKGNQLLNVRLCSHEQAGGGGAACWYKMADILTVNRGHFHSYPTLTANKENIELVNRAHVLCYILEWDWLEPLHSWKFSRKLTFQYFFQLLKEDPEDLIMRTLLSSP